MKKKLDQLNNFCKICYSEKKNFLEKSSTFFVFNNEFGILQKMLKECLK